MTAQGFVGVVVLNVRYKIETTAVCTTFPGKRDVFSQGPNCLGTWTTKCLTRKTIRHIDGANYGHKAATVLHVTDVYNKSSWIRIVHDR